MRLRIGTARPLCAVVATIATLALGTQAEDASGRTSSCAAPHGQRVVASTASVVVTRRGPKFWTCYRPTGRRTVLTTGYQTGSPDSGASGTVETVRAAGVYALYELSEYTSDVADNPPGSEQTTVQVVDVARHDTRTLSTTDDNGNLDFNELALSSAGDLAWDQVDDTDPGPGAVEEIVAKTPSGSTVLDSASLPTASTADPFSHLAFSGAVVTWLDQGTARSAAP